MQYKNPRRKIFIHLFRKRRLKPTEKKSKIEELHSFLAGKQDKVGKEKLSSQTDILSEITRPHTWPIPVVDGWAGAEMHVFPLERDGPTNRRTDKASYRVTSLRLKMELAIF